MSKKKRKHIIKLKVGKFYRVLDGSPTGHPGQIFKIDFGDKEYKDMRFDNSDNVILLSVQKRNPIYGKHYRKRLVKKKPQ